MTTKRTLIIVLVASVIMLTVGIGPRFADSTHALPLAQEPNPPGVTIPYPGRLSDEAGQMVADGAYDFAFALYETPSGGEPLWAETQEGVIVKSGAFVAMLGSVHGIPKEVLEGKECWLEVAVRGPGEAHLTALSPRQRVNAASSAGLPGLASQQACPHDHFGETWIGSGSTGLSITNNGAGNGIYVHTNGQYATLFASNSSTGAGVCGVSDSDGVFGTSSSGNGVHGLSNTGYGVYGESPSGTGVWGKTTTTTGTTTGVWGVVSSPGGYGVYGMNTAGGTGVYGYSVGGSGVYARGANAVVGISESPNYAAIFGRNDATSGTSYGLWGESKSSSGAGGYFKNTAGDGVRVESAGHKGVVVNSADQEGVLVSSAGAVGMRVGQAHGDGVYVGKTDHRGLYVGEAGDDGVYVNSAGDDGVYVNSAGNYGVVVKDAGQYAVWVTGQVMGVNCSTRQAQGNYGLYTDNNIRAANLHAEAAVMHIMQNGGGEPLEPGDVVVFSGLGAPLKENGGPVVRVAKATSANCTGVAGVVSSRYNIEALTDDPTPAADREFTPAGPVPPNEYLLVVVQGPAQVKASTLAGPLQPGDLLSSAGQAGYAAKATEVPLGDVRIALPGTVFGKALEPLDAARDAGLVWVWVTLQ